MLRISGVHSSQKGLNSSFEIFDMKALWETLSKEKNMSITQSDFFSNLLYLCVNFPVLYKYKNMELTLKKYGSELRWDVYLVIFPLISLDSVY